jgi:hypothetical protein
MRWSSIALVCVALLALAPNARAAWAPPTTLPASGMAGAPQVAINARGDGAVAWTSELARPAHTTVLRVAVRRGATGGFATKTLLRRVNRGIGGLSVAIDARARRPSPGSSAP